jgi:hypothetical protein
LDHSGRLSCKQKTKLKKSPFLNLKIEFAPKNIRCIIRLKIKDLMMHSQKEIKEILDKILCTPEMQKQFDIWNSAEIDVLLEQPEKSEQLAKTDSCSK